MFKAALPGCNEMFKQVQELSTQPTTPIPPVPLFCLFLLQQTPPLDCS
jgi:hypothetical protein